MQLDRGEKKTLKLSLTPLIDVVFLLLIFFMLASTFSRFTSLPLSTKSGKGQAVSLTNIILVRINQQGVVDVNGQEVDPSDLISTINSLADKPDMKLIVKPLEGASVQHLVTVLEKAKRSKLNDPVVMR